MLHGQHVSAMPQTFQVRNFTNVNGVFCSISIVKIKYYDSLLQC